MALAPQQQKYGPLAYKSPTLEQVSDIIKNLPKPVINVTPVNKLAQQTIPAPTPFSGGTQNIQYPKALPMTNPRAPMQVSQTGPNTFGTYKTPAPFQTQYLEAGKKRDAQKKAGEYQAPEQKKTPERYVAMDRRTELAQQQRKEVPEIANLPDDEIVEKFVTQFPQFQEYFKLPEAEQDPNQQILEAIRRDYPEAQGMTDEQLLQQWNQHQELTGGDPTAPGAQEVVGGAVKTTPSHGGSGFLGMGNIPNINPILKYNKEKDAGAPNVGKLAVNLPGSTANVGINTLNMLNLGTIKGLSQIFLGAVANLTKGAKSLFVGSDQAEVDSAITLDRLKRKGGNLGKIAQFLDESEELADAVGRGIIEKYGNLDNVARIITEDPMEIVSDIAMLLEGGGTFVKLASKAVKAKTLANISEEVASFGAKSDPYNLTIASAGKTAQKTVETFTTPSKTEGVSINDRLISAYNGLDAQTARMMKDNADLIKKMDEGTLSKDEMQDRTVKIIDDLTDEKGQAGKFYQEAYKDRTTFDAKEIAQDVITGLEQQGVKYNSETGKLSFDITNTAMANLSAEAKTALKSRFDDVMDTLQGKDTLTVEELHNIRKSLNQTKYQDGFQTKKAPGVDKIVTGINNKLKKVPGFAKADKIFSEITTELSQVKKMLTTTDAEGKLHMKGTVKSLLSETGRKKLEVIERYYPDFRRELEAIVAYDDYLNTREKKKVGQYNKPVAGSVGGGVGFALGGGVGAILGAVAGTMLHTFVTDPKRFKNRVVKKLGNKVAKKIEAGKALTRIEKARMDFEAERLLAKPQLALEYKPDLKTEKAQVVDTKGVVKGQPGAQTLQKQAIEDGKIVTKTEVNASPIRIPKRKGNLPEKVVETGQENVRQPRNPAVEAKKAQVEAKVEAKTAKQKKYEDAPGEVITNVKEFKRGMITPEGVITESGFNRTRPFYQVEGDGNAQYRYEGTAKKGPAIKVPGPIAKTLDPREVSDTQKKQPEMIATKTEAEDARDWMEAEISKMGYGETETKLAQDVLRIEEMEKNLGKVGRNKVKDRAYKNSEEIKFLKKKERAIERIQEELGLDANNARDRYDQQAYNAREVKERYQTKQEYSKAPEVVQKTHLSPKEAQARIGKYFTQEEVPVIFQEKITTPRGQEAYGKYHDGAITMTKEPHLTTPDHEAFHAYFDLFTTKNRQKKVLEIVKKKQKIKDNIEAEEWLADNFAEFVAKKQTFTGAVKAFFGDVRNGIKKVFGKEDAVRSLYTDMINKKRPGGDKKIRTNKSAKNQATGVPYLTTKPLQDIGGEIKGTDVTVTHLKNMLGRQYKKQELNQIMEVIRVAEEKGVDKLSKAEVQEITRKEILPLEIKETERYANYNRLYDNSSLDTYNIPRTYGSTHIYETPILTSTQNHFDNMNYFGHIRVEDLVQRKEAPKNVARVIEVQSDLFQAGKETNPRIKAMDRQLDISKIRTNSDNIISVLMYLKDDVRSSNIIKDYIQEMKEALIQYKKMRKVSTDMAEAIGTKRLDKINSLIEIHNKIIDQGETLVTPQMKQLESYANKGAYRKRMVGQEIIEQVKNGKEKIQFPDGVTIAKIEGHDINILSSGDVSKGERTTEQAKEAIGGMDSPKNKTIANFYEKDLIPYLQKQFGGDFVFEDGGRRLEIDLKKTFGDQKKLGIPAFQKKNIYKEIDDGLLVEARKYKSADELKNSLVNWQNKYYHGASVDFTSFKASKGGAHGRGVYLTAEKEMAEAYARADEGEKIIVYEVTLPKNFKRLKDQDLRDKTVAEVKARWKQEGNPITPSTKVSIYNEAGDRVKSMGYDGISLLGEDLVFDPKKITISKKENLQQDKNRQKKLPKNI